MSDALSPRQRARLEELFDRAVELPEAQHTAFVAAECGSDAALRRELASLLEALGTADHLSALRSAASSRARTRIGAYELLERIGEGGMGEVYAAEQREPIVRRVALKIIKPGMDSRQVVARFEAERQALARMSHPNVAQVFDGGATESGSPYFVMELVAGEPLTKYCDRLELSTRERLELFLGVCEGVQHAHQKGIIHRDLKPSNLLVMEQDGRALPKVIDFGVARATTGRLVDRTLNTVAGQIVGTLDYMSPEQADPSSAEIDTRSDIYSLGVVLYQLLSGLLPFEFHLAGDQLFSEIQRTIRETEPPTPSTRLRRQRDSATTVAPLHATDERTLVRELTGDLDWICMKALEKEPARRYSTVSEMGLDLQRHLDGQPVEAAPPSARYRLHKFVRRNRLAVGAAAALVLLLVLGIAGTSYGMLNALDATRSADYEAARARASAALAQESAAAEASARAAAEENEKRAVEARLRAEHMRDFVTAAFDSSDPKNVGGKQDRTILDAMESASQDLDSGRFADEPETEAGLRSTIGHILAHNGRPVEAEAEYEKALALNQRLHDGDHEQVAICLGNLAGARASLSRAVEAVELYTRAVEMNRRLFPGDHAQTATSIHNLAAALMVLERAPEAEPLAMESLEMNRRLYPGDHSKVASDLDLLALARTRMGQLAEAEQLHVQSLEMRQRIFEGDHPEVAVSLNNLGYVREVLGRLAEAEASFEQALDMCQRLYSGDHPRIATSMTNLADVWADQGRGEEALELYEQALEMRSQIYKKDHVDVVVSLKNLGVLLGNLGRHAEAEPRFLEMLEMSERLFPGDNEYVGMSLFLVAQNRDVQGKTAEARQAFDKVIGMLRRLHPAGSPALVNVLAKSSEALRRQGDAAGALLGFEEALALGSKLLPPGDPALAFVRDGLAKCRAASSK